MSSGLLYEPRSLWSIANVRVAEDAPGPTRVRLPKRHFFNGERYPIELRRLSLCAVNYHLMDDTIRFFQHAELAISVPQRYHLNTKRFLPVAGLTARPTWQPSTPFAPLSSNLWGSSMLNFDNPLYIAKDAFIEWSLSAITPVSDSDVLDPIHAKMLYQEEGGLWPGSVRSHEVELPFISTDVLPGFQFDPLEKWPFFPFGAPAVTGGTNIFWDPRGFFSGNRFLQQEHTRDGSTKLTDMRAAIDQRAYDELQVFAGVQPSPLHFRIGTRARMGNGGTKAWWWRPGAPLALVFDHITPACVYELKEPVTLGPGEQLDVEMLFPPIVGEDTAEYHVGISFNGFAVIEG
jgi:hypothetical protein